MTISSTTRKAGPYTGNGSASAFPFAFKVFAASDLYVVKTNTTLGADSVLVLGTDYTVSLNADQNANPGGMITLTAGALASGYNLTITSSLQYLQPTDLTNQGGFYPSVITNALDRLTIFCQQLYDAVSRSLKVSVSTPSGVSTTLPPPAANKLIGWNATADNLQNMDPTALATIVAFGTANADKFNGDGTTTQFTLSANPGALNNLDVSIGGVTQLPGIDYSWGAGMTITFTVAPPVGTNNVLVRYMQALPQGAADAGAVTFSMSETYGQGTAGQKLLEFLSVKAAPFNAKGDGVTDDTLAIQSAIDFAKTNGIGFVLFPYGNYKITSPLYVRGSFGYAGIELRGENSTITQTGNAAALVIDATNPSPAPEYRIRALVRGFYFNGPGVANTGSVGIQCQNGANIEVRDCSIRNFYRGLYGYGALISHFDHLAINKNYYGIQFENTAAFAPNDVHFYNCKVWDNTRAVRCINFPNGAITFTDCEIEGNNLSGTTSDGIRVTEFFNAGKVTLIGCHFEQNPGQYNVYYNGGSSSASLNVIGCEMIPGDSCGNIIYMAAVTTAAHLFVEGSRVANNVGTNQIVLDTGVSALIIGETAGGISGDTSKTVIIKNGRIGVGGSLPDFGGIRSKSAAGISLDSEGYIRFVDSSNNRLGYVAATAIRLDANAQYSIGANDTADIVLRRAGTATFEPGADNTYTLGTGGMRWSTVYAATGTINTSDERTKQQIKPIDEAALRAWARVEYTQFRFNDAVEQKGDGARWHFGLIAQRVKEAFEAEGLDPFAYGILCFDDWQDIEIDEPVLDEKGEFVIDEKTGTPKVEKKLLHIGGNRYGVRYDEALALECAYLRSRLN